MKPFDEIDLAAYHLGELPPRRARLLEEALQTNASLAAESEVYASMLRTFKNHALLEVDEEAVERHWQRIRYHLPPHAVHPRFTGRRIVAVAATGLAFAAVVLYVRTPPVAPVAPAAAPSASEASAATTDNPPAAATDKPSAATTGLPTSDDGTPAASTPTSPQVRRGLSKRVARQLFSADTGSPAFPDAAPIASPRMPQPLARDAAPLTRDAAAALYPTPLAPTPIPSPPDRAGSSTELAAAAQASQSGGLSAHRKGSHALHHEHTTDVTLAMGGVLSSRSLSAENTTQVVGATHAVSAIGSFHQQLRPLVGYRVTVSYSRPDFDFENRSYGGFHINGRIYEVAGTYVVQGPRRGFVRTAVEAGAGLMTILPTENTSTLGKNTRAAGIAGVSAEVAVSRHVAVQAAYRLQVFRAPDFHVSGFPYPLATPVTASTLVSNEPSLGITYRFSRQ